MALPKKKKRLHDPIKDDAASPDKPIPESAALSPAPAPKKSPGGTVNEQMEKAFEMVNTIEQIHPLPGAAAPARSAISQFPDPDNPETVRLRLSLDVPHGETKNEASMPVISLNLKIPSFLWKVPVIGGAARNLIRKLAKE